MKRIGIFGGTFNPIHIGHMHVADVVAEKYGLDELHFVPAGNPYMKSKDNMASCEQRSTMVGIAIGRGPATFYVSNVDIVRHGSTYAVDTILDYKRIYPDAQLFFIAGADAYNQMPHWKDYDLLKTMCKFIVAADRGNEYLRPRVGIENSNIEFVTCLSPNISSSNIRNMISKGIPCRYLLPAGVYDYIEEQGLYKGEKE